MAYPHPLYALLFAQSWQLIGLTKMRTTKKAEKSLEKLAKNAGFNSFRWIGKELRCIPSDSIDAIFVKYEINEDETKARISSVFPAHSTFKIGTMLA